MQETVLTNLIIISQPGRKRDNLAVLARMATFPKEVFVFDSIQNAPTSVFEEKPALILVDYRQPEEGLEQDIAIIHQQYPDHSFVLLTGGAKQDHQLNGAIFFEYVFDEISQPLLISLLRTLETQQQSKS